MAPRIFDKLDLTTQESDMPRYLLRTQTDHTLLFFTDRGQCYPLAVSAINESLRPKERGVALTGILQGIEADEKCVRILDIAPKAFERAILRRTVQSSSAVLPRSTLCVVSVLPPWR